MNILLDTHIFLWSLGEPEMLTKRQISAILNTDNSMFISHYSFMEIAIKQALKKMPEVKRTIQGLANKALENDYQIKSSDLSHSITYLNIPLFENHRDPFDRFIIATAKTENMYIMTNDSKFAQYQDIVQIW